MAQDGRGVVHLLLLAGRVEDAHGADDVGDEADERHYEAEAAEEEIGENSVINMVRSITRRRVADRYDPVTES